MQLITLTIQVDDDLSDPHLCALADEIAGRMEDVFDMRRWPFEWWFDDATNNLRNTVEAEEPED